MGIYLGALAIVYGVMRATKRLPRTRRDVIAAGVAGSLGIGLAAGLTLALVVQAIPTPVWSASGAGGSSGPLPVDLPGSYELTIAPTGECGPVGTVAEGGTEFMTAVKGQPGRADLYPGHRYAWEAHTFGTDCGWTLALYRRGEATWPKSSPR